MALVIVALKYCIIKEANATNMRYTPDIVDIHRGVGAGGVERYSVPHSQHGLAGSGSPRNNFSGYGRSGGKVAGARFPGYMRSGW